MTTLKRVIPLIAVIFFFSSRRRHTRCSRDWSSDVCSSDLSSWLYRLTVNEVLLGRRADHRREERIVTSDNPAALERPRDAATGLALDLERAVAALPSGAREVFVLHDVEGYRHEEIARLTGIAVGTSKAQLFRARRLLREGLNR